MSGLDDPRTQEGVAHLQAAARELIAAARAFLDVAEEVVADPTAVQDWARSASDLVQTVISSSTHRAHDSDDREDPRIERIPVR